MVKQYDIYWVALDPTVGSEIKKTRPCLIISPDETNLYLNTVLVAPVTSTVRNFPIRFNVNVTGKRGQVALDQIRCVDKSRLSNKITSLKSSQVKKFKNLLKGFLID